MMRMGKKPFPDQVGRLGEKLVEAALSRPVRGRFNRPLFRVVHLGEKYPVADLLVSVVNSKDIPICFFLVQIRSTEKTPSSLRRPLRVRVAQEKLRQLAKLPMPTYVVAVDTAREQLFIVSAWRSKKGGIRKVARRFDLSKDSIRIELYNEVMKFWKKAALAKRKSRFTNG